MKYINAAAVLPASLVEELQNYVQSGYLYVPAREGQHRAWGERNGGREELRKRNRDILDAWQNGVSMETLADQYCLSILAGSDYGLRPSQGQSRA